jgi:hypothetical protein
MLQIAFRAGKERNLFLIFLRFRELEISQSASFRDSLEGQIC